MLINNTPAEASGFDESRFEEGLSLYEVIRVFNRNPIFLQDNILRLSNSIKRSNIDLDVRTLNIAEKLSRLIALEQMQEGNIKYVLHFTKDRMDEYVYRIPHTYPTEKEYAEGVETVSIQAVRTDPQIKYINNELRARANSLMHMKGAYEAVLTDREGRVTEGSRSNLFLVKNGRFYTAPDTLVLPGTSRKRILDICKEMHWPVVEEAVPYDALGEYEGAFLTGTSPLILPVRRLDRFVFNVREPHLRALMELYFEQIEKIF
ncbi:MAG: aminotransferase class IV [Culturomica sp.]|jgi:branched-chain amino acid aminotransferase|nr:aminotransferase class IV [Culturomica sp.]